MLGTVAQTGGGPGVFPREILGFLCSSRVDLNQFYHVFYLTVTFLSLKIGTFFHLSGHPGQGLKIRIVLGKSGHLAGLDRACVLNGRPLGCLNSSCSLGHPHSHRP